MKFNISRARSVAPATLLWLTGLFGPVAAVANTKTTLSQGSSNSETTFVNRRALVGHSCMVTSTGSGLASVVSIPDSVENICDENLNNTAIFTSVVGAGVADQQLVGVKDLEHYYAAGTVAGFLVTSSKTKLLGADVADMFTIQFYRDGKLVETKKVTAGQDASVLSVSLIQIGNKDACQEYTATSTVAFDEIRLAQVGVLTLDVVGSLGIKYAFVGKAKEYTITQESMAEYAKYVGRTTFDVQSRSTSPSKGEVAAVSIDWNTNGFIDDNDTTNRTAIAAVASLFTTAHASVRALPAENNTENDNTDTFKKGTTIGFKFRSAYALELGVGSSIVIELYNKKGDKVETHLISIDVLNLGVGGVQIGKCSVVATSDFSRADIYMSGVKVVVGGTSVYYAYVVLPPTVQSADDDDNDLVLNESTTLAETSDHSSARLILRRSFNENAWNSLILPVDLSKDEFEEAFGSDAKLSKFYTVTTGDDDVTTLKFSEVEYETNGVFLAKNTPYLIYLPDGNDELHPSTALYQTLDSTTVSGPLYIVETGVDFDADDVMPSKVTGSGVTFTGSYDAAQSLTAGWYVFNKGDLYHTTKAHTQKAYRCWIEYSPTSGAKETVLSGFGVDGDGTTAIRKVMSDGTTLLNDGSIYNLKGQRIDSSAKLSHGIYLMGNKKFIVK